MLNSLDSFEKRTYMKLSLNEKINYKGDQLRYFTALGVLEHGLSIDCLYVLDRRFRRFITKLDTKLGLHEEIPYYMILDSL